MQAIRRLFGFSSPDVFVPDEEAAASISSIPRAKPSASRGQRMSQQRVKERLVAHEDKLAVFRRLTGIDSSQHLVYSTVLSRPAANLGLYARIVRSQVQGRRYYKVYSFIINCCLGIQLVVAATLTALGASQGSASAVAGLGAVNTIIAGFLTYLKGSGMPNRLRYNESEWRKVREYIEQRERDFQREYCALDPVEEAKIVEDMYNRVREDIEMNAPDAYTSATRLSTAPQTPDMGKALSVSDLARSEKAVPEMRSSKALTGTHRGSDLQSKAGQLASDAFHSRAGQALAGALHLRHDHAERPDSATAESKDGEVAAEWAYAQSLGANPDFARTRIPQPDPAILRSSSMSDHRKSAQFPTARPPSGFWPSSPISQGASDDVLAKAAKAATEVIRAEAEKTAAAAAKGEPAEVAGHEAEGSSSFEKKILGLVGLERTKEDGSKDKEKDKEKE